MSGYGNTPPGSEQVSVTRYARRVLMTGGQGGTDTSGAISANGMGRVTVRGRLTAGVPGPVIVVSERIEGQSFDEIGRFALAALGTTYTETFHVSGSDIRVDFDNAAVGDQATVLIDLSAAS